MSRNQARDAFTAEDLRAAMSGIVYRDNADTVDEHPQAYKRIDQVMEDARDLVEIKYTLRQLLNVKGD